MARTVIRSFPTLSLGCILTTVLISQEAFAEAVSLDPAIESILIKRCSECHGPDQQKAKLRLDSRKSALLSGKSGKPAVVPGKPEDSELIHRITSTDPDEVMPPKGAKLTAEQVTSLRKWIQDGAVWPEADPRSHWAFQKPSRPPLPTVQNSSWGRNEIDRFILSKLEKEKLTPSPEADRYTLARRVYLDLTGLPPRWEDIQKFVQDPSPDAYERLVDRLLASQHYGEHMARNWLDLARYADSNGYQVDLARSNWAYREWVIQAFNRNLPFNQFTVEQLAGDLLPHPTPQQLIATGFNRNTKINDEGGGDAEEYRVKAVKDRVATLGTTWLGLTLNCAECHTHKYDPITQEEYYQIYAFFNNTADGGSHSTAPHVEVPKPDLTDTFTYLSNQLAQTKIHLQEEEHKQLKDQARWEKTWAKQSAHWTPLTLTNAYSNGGSSYTNLPDGSLLGLGVNPIYDTITIDTTTSLTNITAVLLEVLPDPSLPKNGPGRWRETGNFILDELSLSAAPLAGARPAETNVYFRKATADWEQLYYRAEHAVDRNPKTGWAIGPQFGQRHFLIAELAKPSGFAGGTQLTFRFDHYHGSSHCIGRFRISVTTESPSDLLWPAPPEVSTALETPSARRTEEQTKSLISFHRQTSPVIRKLLQDQFRLETRLSELRSQSYHTLVMKERSEPTPRETYIQVRGDFLTKGKTVTPGVPAVFPSLPAATPPNRLALAEWLVDPNHPLTARVTVNRFWERFFGTGIVKTSEDFGKQGEPPSHPELLDWLATEFIRTGWDIKAMQRLIVLSAAYRQSSVTDSPRLEKDFYNRWLSRGPRFRMDAEMLRDQALSVSGLLNDKIGGPSVYPIQVPNLWKEIGFLRPEIGMDEWPQSEGPDLYRRAVYTFWRRVCTYPTFAAFDAPSREVCVSRRPRTNTPLQALAALNEPTFLEAARVFAQNVLRDGGRSENAQMEYAIRTCLLRPPTNAERSKLRNFLHQQQKSYSRDLASARALIAVGTAPTDASLDPRQVASWMMVANVLLNLDETLTKE